MLAMSLGSSVGRMADERKEVPWYQDVAADVKDTAQGVGQSVTRGMQGAYRGLQWVGRGVGSFFSPLSPDLDPVMGPASVYQRRPNRRGMIYRPGREVAPPISLPPPSPEVTAPGYVWSLETAIARALVANPSLVESRLMLQRQRGVEAEVGAKRLPQVAVLATADRRDPDSIDRSRSELTLPITSRTAIADRSFDLRVEVRQLLFDGGGVSNSVKREKLQTLQAKMALQVAAYRTVALVKQHYETVLFREVTLGNVQRRETSLRQIADWTERRWKLGEQPELEYLRAATELKLAQAEVVRAQSELRQARVGLARQLYLPTQDNRSPDLVLSGELSPKSVSLALDEAISLATANRLDLQSGKLQIKSAEHTVKAIKSDQLPKIEAVAGYGQRTSYYDYHRELEGWTVGVSGRWSLFDGHATRGRLQAYRAEQRVAQVRVENLDLQVRTEVVELFARLDQAKAALSAQAEAKALAEKSLVHARRAYELGQANLEQVLETENVLLRSQNAYAETVVTLNATIAQLEFGVGGVLPGGRDVGMEVLP
jgi:outer membrane protein